MEETNALLSNLVQTKSIERVLAPIAAQVSQLIILNEAYEKGDKKSFPPDLLPSAEAVRQSAHGLVQVGQRLALQATDEDLKMKMPQACDLLDAAGGNLVTATQRVHSDGFSRSARRHMVRAAKEVLEGTLKVLLVSDDAEVRHITQAVQETIQNLGVLTTVKAMNQLVHGFKVLTESVMKLTGLADRRQKELTHPGQRERLITAMTTLKKSVPMLSSAMQTYVKYPNNAQSQLSKDYVLGQVLEAVDDIKCAVENRLLGDDLEFEEPDEPGHFITKMDQLLDQLSNQNRLELAEVGSEFDSILEVAIRHSMAIAHLSTAGHRDLIIQASRRVLHQRSKVSDLAKSVIANTDLEELREDFDEVCETLMDELQDLERHVNASILQLIVDVLKDTTEPLDRLMKAALTPIQERAPLQEAVCASILEPYIDAFHTHADRVCQVARFAAASSSDSRRVRTIRGCLNHAERLDPEIVPATMACRRDVLDRAAMEHLRLLKREWNSAITNMVAAIDEITDPRMFIEVSELQLHENLERCKNSKYMDTVDVTEVTKALIGRARRVLVVAGHLVDNSTDPVYRNGLMVYVSQLSKAVPVVKSALRRVESDPSELRWHEALHKRCDLVVSCVAKLREGLEENNHPHLLSPARRDVRPLAGLRAMGLEDELEVDKENINTNQSIEFADEVDADVDKTAVHSGSPLTSAESYLSKPAMRHGSSSDFSKTESSFASNLSLSISNILDNSTNPCFVDVTVGHLSVLTQSLVQAAIAGQRQRVDLLSNDILAAANHMMEIANSIAVCDRDHKQIMLDAVSEITGLTPQLLDKANKVVDCDVNQVEPLHKAAAQWTTKVSELELRVDRLLDRWKVVSNKVVDAAKVGNKPLLAAEIQHVGQQQRHLQGLVAMATKCVDHSNIFSVEQVESLKEYSNEFDNLCTMLCTLADVLSKSENPEEKAQLDNTGREWASKVFCITRTIDDLALGAVSKVIGEQVMDKREDFTQLQKVLKVFTDDTIRLKELLNNAVHGCPDSRKTQQADTMCDDLDQLNAQMQNCYGLITHTTAPFHTTEKLYAPQQMSVLQWQWAAKAGQLLTLVDELTLDLTSGVMSLGNIAQASSATSPGSQKEALEQSFQRQSEGLTSRFMKAKTKTLDAIQMSGDIEQKSKIRRHLEELGQLTEGLVSTAGDLKEERVSDGKQQEFDQARRQWACKAQLMLAELNTLQDVNTGAVTAVDQLLKAKPEVSIHAGGVRDRATEVTPGGQTLNKASSAHTPEFGIKAVEKADSSSKSTQTWHREALSVGKDQHQLTNHTYISTSSDMEVEKCYRFIPSQLPPYTSSSSEVDMGNKHSRVMDVPRIVAQSVQEARVVLSSESDAPEVSANLMTSCSLPERVSVVPPIIARLVHEARIVLSSESDGPEGSVNLMKSGSWSDRVAGPSTHLTYKVPAVHVAPNTSDKSSDSDMAEFSTKRLLPVLYKYARRVAGPASYIAHSIEESHITFSSSGRSSESDIPGPATKFITPVKMRRIRRSPQRVHFADKTQVMAYSVGGSTSDSGSSSPVLATRRQAKPYSYHGYTPPAPVSTATFQPGEVSSAYKEMKKGPIAQHKTPEKPRNSTPFKSPNRTLTTAALNLRLETDSWEDNHNPIVRVAKEMTQQLCDMADFTRGQGAITNKQDLIKTAKAIAKNGETITTFARILADNCVDKRFSKDLLYHADHIPTVATQLNILASVKAATPDDRTAEKMLVKNAENLMDAMDKTLKAAEAVCVKGLRQPSGDAVDETEAIILATRWKRKFQQHRLVESTNAATDELGLRRVSRNSPAPGLSQILHRR